MGRGSISYFAATSSVGLSIGFSVGFTIELYFLPQISYFSRESELEFLMKIFLTSGRLLYININLYHPNGHICLVPIHFSLPFFTSPSRVPIPCQPCLPASAALTLPTSIPCGNNATSFTPIKHPTGFAIFNHCHHTRRGSPSQPYM